MGLAGRKRKQRLPADPRNLTWADDASRFGHSYLAKFGWDASQGLGSSGDGMKTHLKVKQKLDLMGIGAQHQGDPKGIAWKQNTEFEALLKRLNESAEQGKGADDHDAEEEDEKELETTMGKVRAQEKKAEGNSATTKKRKHDDPHTSDKTNKKRKKEKREKSSSEDPTAPTSEPPSTVSLSESHPGPTPKPRPMAHRARIRAAKRIAGKSASAISEILGIAPSSSTSTSTTTPTPPSDSTPASLSLSNLTTSTKSLTDYFKEKLARSFSSTPSGSATPCLGATGSGPGLSNDTPPDDDGEPLRRGIGSRVPVVDADGQDMLTEKRRRKAERKAEKHKRREAEDESTDVKERTEEDEARVQKTSKENKQTKRRERKQLDDDDDSEKGHEHEDKKSKKKHKKERS